MTEVTDVTEPEAPKTRKKKSDTDKRLEALGVKAQIITPPEKIRVRLLTNGHCEVLGGHTLVWKKGDVVEVSKTTMHRRVNKMEEVSPDTPLSMPKTLAK